MESNLYARRNEKTGRKQLLREHLDNVAVMAACFSAIFGCENWGRLLGLMHDVGKAQKDFQKKLDGEAIRVEHSGSGAVAIAGHHGRLTSSTEIYERIEKNKKLLPLLGEWGIPPEIALETPSWLQGRFGDTQKRSVEFLGRFFASVLVDADRLDAEQYDLTVEAEAEGKEAVSLRGGYPSMHALQRVTNSIKK